MIALFPKLWMKTRKQVLPTMKMYVFWNVTCF